MSITHIASATAAGGSSSATTGAIDSTGANLAVIASGRLAFAGVTWSDSKGNTYTALSVYSHSIFRGGLAYCLNPTVGSGHTFTTSGASEPAVGASVFAGVDAYDQESGSGGGGSSTRQPGSITPPSDGCLFFTGFTADNNNYWAVNSGFTLAGSIDSSPGTHFSVAWAYKIQTGAAAAENPTWTEVGSNNNNIASMATFTAAAAADEFSPDSLSSGEFFGTPSITLTVTADELSSDEAFGSPTLTLTLTADSLSSDEAFGEASLSDVLSLVPDSLSSDESFGAPSITLTVTADALSSDDAFGTATLTLTLTADSLGSDEAFGEASVSDVLSLVPDSLSSDDSFGTPSITLAVTADALSSDEGFGSPTLTLTLTADSLSSDEAFGEASISDVLSLVPDSLGSEESFGTPTITLTVTADALSSDDAFGTATLTLTLTADSLSSDEAFAVAALSGGIQGGYRIYSRNLIDGDDVLVAFVSSGIDEYLVTGAPESEAWYHVKAVTRCAVEDIEPIRLKRVAFDADGHLILPVPHPPVGLRLVCGADGAVEARWNYITNNQPAAPALFNVYVATGSDEIDFGTPQQSVNYSGARTFSADLGEFAHGTIVRVVVRSEAASGAEERNVITVTAHADAEAPTAATSLQVEVIAS